MRDNRLLLLALVLLFLEKKRGVDGEPGRGFNFEESLLPALIQSALTGEQIDTQGLLSALLTGKREATAPDVLGPIASPQQSLVALLMPLLLEKLTGRHSPDALSSETKPASPNTKLPSTGPLIGADSEASLGQVNAALGETIGKLLNGKKTAIGLIGSLLTQLLANVPAGSALADILVKITPLTGLSGYTLPIFLALTAWGVLGKMEKWEQGTAPPPRIIK